MSMSFEDFQGQVGGLQYNANGMRQAEELHKAMTNAAERSVVGQASPGDLKPIRVEQLDPLLKICTHEERHLKLWPVINKDRAYSVLNEFAQLKDVGNSDMFFADGNLPAEDDSTYVREALKIKVMGQTRRLPFSALMSQTMAGPGVNPDDLSGFDGGRNAALVARENRNGTLAILRQLEVALFTGDSSVVPESFDGLATQLRQKSPRTVLDARGKTINESLMEDVMNIISDRPNYGMPTDVFASANAHGQLAKVYFDRMRREFGKAVTPDYRLESIRHTFGSEVNYHRAVFLGAGEGPEATGRGEVGKRPVAPMIVAQPAVVAGGPHATSKFVNADAGAYLYQISAVNARGVSVPVTLTPVNVAAAGDLIRATVRDGGAGSNRATGFILYRSRKGEGAESCREFARIANPGGDVVFTDGNEDLPGTQSIFVISNKATSLQWKQLLPFTKMPLPLLDTSYRWMLLLYGALEVGIPQHHGVIKNVAFTT